MQSIVAKLFIPQGHISFFMYFINYEMLHKMFQIKTAGQLRQLNTAVDMNTLDEN